MAAIPILVIAVVQGWLLRVEIARFVPIWSL